MKRIKLSVGLLAISLCSIFSASAKVTLGGGADIVSSYVWRGAYTSSSSVQPYIELGAGNFTVGAWGSTPIETQPQLNEVDFYASYSIGDFSVTVTDYWWDGNCMPYTAGNHFYETSLAYTFSEKFPLSVSVNTMVAGDDDDFSTYIALDYPIAIGSASLDLGVGVTPAAGMYADGFAVCNLSACASKSIKITDSFELPLSVTSIYNPDRDNIFLVFGTSLSF